MAFTDTKISGHESVDDFIVESRREIDGKIEQETRFYLTSLVWLANQLGPVVRSHWSVENNLHWLMDMIFLDDDCRVRTDHAPANFTALRHIVHNLIRKGPRQRFFATAAQSRCLGMSSS
jgi:predicted transposase YbfD/YdcC